jgi:hypothetical protein
MASLQDLKNRLTNPNPKKENNKTPDSTLPSLEEDSRPIPTLEIEEARYLLSLIAKSDFSGKDIQIVYDTALKLQEIIKETLDQNNSNTDG